LKETIMRIPTLAFRRAGLLTFVALAVTLSSSAIARACSNAPVRAAQGATYLADCRAYEQVSPVDKINASLLDYTDGGAIWNLTNVSRDGSIATFQSRGGFADAANNNYVIDYVAKRGPQGWTTTSPVFQRPSGYSNMQIGLGYSDDFSAYFSIAGDPAVVAGASPGRNLYMRDLNDGSTQVLTGGAQPGSSTTPEVSYIKASSGREHVVFETSNAITDDAPAGALSNVYDWTGGKAELVGILPNDSVDPEGSVAGSVAEGDLYNGVRNAYRAVSADGRRIFFSSPPNDLEAQVYVRIDGSQTKHVSKSQRTVPDPDGTQPAFYWGASEDGSVVYFTSAEKLTDDSTADATTGQRDLYRYDVDSGQLTDLSVAPDGAGVRYVAAISEDGSRVYFGATGALTSDAAPTSGVNVYVWDNGQIKLVAGDIAGSGFRLGGNGFGGDSQTNVAATPDGKRFAFATPSKLTDYDAQGGKSIYLYDAPTDSLRCVSCNPTGEPPSYGSYLYVGGNALTPVNTFGDSNSIYQPTRSITDDGSRVFFTSDDALLAQDVNGQPDVYQWSEGELSLISSGLNSEGSFLQTITPSGSDVLFGTREQLVASDGDYARDLYSARVEGGFSTAGQLSPCAGESCRGPASAPPTPPPASSATFSGPANPQLRKKNRRHKAQKRQAKKKAKARQKKTNGKHRNKPSAKRHG
jgi:hypothetical protein